MALPSFQLLDKNKQPIPINKIDEEICQLIGVEVKKKKYAVYHPREYFPNTKKGEWDFKNQISWYDDLGWQMANGKSFQEIIEEFKEFFKEFLGETDQDGTIITLEVINPNKMKILNYWIEKGYEPKSIKN